MTLLYEQFFMAAEGRLCILNQEGKILAVNTALCQTLKYQQSELVGTLFQDLIHKQHRRHFIAHIQDVDCKNLLIFLQRKDGSFQNFYWHHKTVEGLVQAKLSNEFRFANTKIEHSVGSYPIDNILNKQVLDDGVWDWDLEKYTMYYSPRWKEILGYTDEELYNDVTTWQNLIHHEDLKATLQLIQDYNTGKVQNFEIMQRYYHKNNSTVYVYCRATHFKDADGKVVRMVGIVNDITKIKLAEERQKKSERILSKAQEIVKMGSWEWDIVENKIIWSEQLYKLLGFEVNEFVPQPETFLKYLHADDKQNVMKTVWTCIQNHKAETLECRAICKDGREILVRCEGYIEYDVFNALSRVVGVIWDITEQKKAEQELIRAKEVAEASVKTKEQFISTMSHEIRTPMNAVIGMTNLLLQENPQPHQTEYLGVLQSAAKNLLLLINDILDFSKIEAGKIVFEKIDFDLKDLLNNIHNIYSYSAKEKGLAFQLEYDENIYPLLVGDPTKLSQIITNLISNAIKFTQQGTVKVIVSLVTQQKQDYAIKFAVTDTGIGIPQDKLETIFDSFTQASIDTTRKFGGTGLGLTISKNLVALQGGSMNVQSKLGVGTTFYFVLTFEKSFAKIIPTSLQNNHYLEGVKQDELEGLNILVAEDNEANRYVISRFLKNWKVNYAFAVNGKEVVEKIQEKEYDLVFMDLHMPELDGYEATKQIRLLPNKLYQEIPIIALTASVLSEVGARIHELGMNDFLLKPFEPRDLYQKIINHTRPKINHLAEQPKNTVIAEKISNSSKNQAITEDITSVSVIKSIDFKHLEAITMGETGFAKELLQLYVKQFTDYVAQLSILITKQNASDVHALNHKVKSTITILQLQNSLYKEQNLLEEVIALKDAVRINLQFEKVCELCEDVKQLLVEKLALMQ
jgi:PAS domain S-box-containing protein